jgi:hypothetical protein
MPTIRSALLIVMLAGLLPRPATAQEVSYDFDKTETFTELRTFAFKDGTPSDTPLVDERIRTAIAAELSARGLTRDDAAPDAYIVTHLTFEKTKDMTVYSSPYWYGPYGWYWGGGWGPTDVRIEEIVMGTLIIDVVNAAKGKLVWRGIGVKEVKPGREPSKIDKNVRKAVAKILENYPPDRAN